MHFVKLLRITCLLAVCGSCASSAMAQVTRFVVTLAGSDQPISSAPVQVAGSNLLLRVTAVDTGGNVVPGYQQNVTVALAEPTVQNSLWASIIVPSASFTNGVADNIAITTRHAGTGDRRIFVTDGNVATYDAAGAFSINPSRFAVTVNGSDFPLNSISWVKGASSASVAVRVTAFNTDGTRAQSYVGNVTLASNNGGFTSGVVANFNGTTNGRVDNVLITLVTGAGPASDSVSASDGLTATALASSTFTIATPGPNTGTRGTTPGATQAITASATVVIGAPTLQGTPAPGALVSVRFTATVPQSGAAGTGGATPQPPVEPISLNGPIDYFITIRTSGNEVVATGIVQGGAINGSISSATTSTISGSIAIPQNAEPGAYIVEVAVGTRSGNSGEGAFTIASLPDLAIMRFDYTPGEYRAGDAMRFDMTWQNLPTNTTTNAPNAAVRLITNEVYRVEIHLSSDTVFGGNDDLLVWQGTFVGNNRGFPLLAGSHVSISDEFIFPSNFDGNYYLLAKVNSAGGREANFSTGFPEVIGPTPGGTLFDGNNVTLAREDGKITLLPAQSPETTRISLGEGDTQSTGISDRPSVNLDGRFVAFQSMGALAGATTPNLTNIFVRDTLANVTSLVSRSSIGGAANGQSAFARINADGRYVVFQSDATNLVPNDTNGFTDIIIADRQLNSITRLITAGGAQTNQGSFLPDISANGRFVVFESLATNLVPAAGAPAGVRQIYLYDRDVSGSGQLDRSGNTAYTLVSRMPGGGAAGNASSGTPRISRDGAYVVFSTRAANLLGSAAPFQQVVRWERATGTLLPVSTPAAGGSLADGDTSFPIINGNGEYVVFASRAKNLTGDVYATGVPHLFRARITGGTVATMLRVNGAGNVEFNNPSSGPFAPDLGSFEPALSDDGRYLTFTSESTNLLPPIPVRHIDRTTYQSTAVQNYEDRTRASDVYLTDLLDPATPVLSRVSLSRFGYESTVWATSGLLTSQVPSHRSPAISGNGGYIAFASDAKQHSGLVFGATNFDYVATNAVRDVYLVNRKTGLPADPSDIPVARITMPAVTTVTSAATVNLTAEITSFSRPVLRVDFFADGNLVATANAAGASGATQFSTSWALAPLGIPADRDFQLTAVAVDSLGLQSRPTAPVTVSVRRNRDPLVEILTPTDGSVLSSGSSVTITAQATDTDGTIANVQFFVDGQSLGTVTSAPYTISWTPGIPGAYTVAAIATDNGGATSPEARSRVFVTFETRRSPLVDAEEYIGTTYSDLAGRFSGEDELANLVAAFDAGTRDRASLMSELFNSAYFTETSRLTLLHRGLIGTWPTPSEMAALRAAAQSGPTGGGTGDDHGNTFATATQLTSAQTPGQISTFGDIDFFRFTVPADNTVVTIRTTGSTDTFGDLYNSNEVLIASDDDSGAGFNFQIQRALDAGTYFISVRGWSLLTLGAYTLNVVGVELTGNVEGGGNVAFSNAASFLLASEAYVQRYGVFSASTDAARRTFFGNFYRNLYGQEPNANQLMLGSTAIRDLGAPDYLSAIAAGEKITLNNGVSRIDPITNPPDISGRLRAAAAISANLKIRPTDALVAQFAPLSPPALASALLARAEYANRFITILTAPRSQNLGLGGSLALSVDAAGTQPMTYQWYRDGVAIAGARSPVFLRDNVSAADTGFYTVEVRNAIGSVYSPSAIVTVGGGGNRLANLSTRGGTGAGGQSLIAGFVINGVPRQVLVRAAGPTLASFGVESVIADPSLQLIRDGVVIATNNNWTENGAAVTAAVAEATVRVGAFAFPSNSLESSILTTLAPGAYTAIVGSAGQSGATLVEVYDVSPGGADLLRNVATRGRVGGAGEPALIGGFVARGTATSRVLIRAVGPTLAGFGVADAASDVRVVIRNAAGTVVGENDNWQDGGAGPNIAAAAAQIGAFALGESSKDAALLLILPEGAYTAEVTGVNGATGTALIEVYDLD